MKLGIIFPTRDFVHDAGAIREFAQGAESLGFEHVLVPDHVLMSNPLASPQAPAAIDTPFHEPLTLLAYMAGITRRMELATGILILPQRQTVLVAKQAAEVDFLSEGRLRLGVGVGHRQMEYDALGQDFQTRGRREAEQIELMRALWTQEIVTYHGRWHKILDAGLGVMPVQRPIPIWLGGGETDAVLRRIGRLADGWIVPSAPLPSLRASLKKIRAFAIEAGRDPNAISVVVRIQTSPDQWRTQAEEWKALGASHLIVRTTAGFTKPEQHLKEAEQFKQAMAGI